ncbi:hypothetical protein SNEBB_004018 [Seison nebaliae]|nr:hypothetical protein SNEBB_004018 [Seison nebaliae]
MENFYFGVSGISKEHLRYLRSNLLNGNENNLPKFSLFSELGEEDLDKLDLINLPHYEEWSLNNEQLRRIGDDSSMIHSTPNQTIVGLADGVGGGRMRGLSPSQFSLQLLKNCCKLLNENGRSGKNRSTNDFVGIEDIYRLFIEKNENNDDIYNRIIKRKNDANESLKRKIRRNKENKTPLHPSSSNDLYRLLDSAYNELYEQKIYGSTTICLLSIQRSSNPSTMFSELNNSKSSSSLLSTSSSDHHLYNSNNYDSGVDVRSTKTSESSDLFLDDIRRHRLRYLILGDSGVAILRRSSSISFDGIYNNSNEFGWTVIERFEPQIHNINAPYQLGISPETLDDITFYRDSPCDATLTHCDIRSGDIIVMGTDGLWNNLFEYRLKNIIQITLNSNDSITKQTIQLLTNRVIKAILCSNDCKYDDVLCQIIYVNNQLLCTG